MMTFMKKEINYKPVNPAAFVMALGYKLGNEDIDLWNQTRSKSVSTVF